MSTFYKLPLKQSIGVTAAPVVKTGDEVRRGQVIARPDGLGALLHASVSGKIAETGEEYIVIEASAKQPDNYELIPVSENIAEMVRLAGVVGMGGAGFPTHVKLGAKLQGGAVIINAAECEPLLKHNIAQLLREPEKVYRGLLLSMKSTGAARGILAIKSKNGNAIEAFRQVIRPGDNVEIAELRDLYPMGEERAIIRDVLGVLLGVDQLPSVAGAVIINVETAARVTEAVDERKPVISKNLTVAGLLKGGKAPRVFMDVPLGTPISSLIDECGGLDGQTGEIVMGGPFTGKSASQDAPVVKTTGGVIVTMEFPKEKRPLGLLVCACGGSEERMREIADHMSARVVSVRRCKQARQVKGALKCENPGECPGQAEKILEMRKEGAEALLIGNCSDCSNTVMGVAPKLKMGVHHQTDTIMRTFNLPLVRRLPLSAG